MLSVLNSNYYCGQRKWWKVLLSMSSPQKPPTSSTEKPAKEILSARPTQFDLWEAPRHPKGWIKTPKNLKANCQIKIITEQSKLNVTSSGEHWEHVVSSCCSFSTKEPSEELVYSLARATEESGDWSSLTTVIRCRAWPTSPVLLQALIHCSHSASNPETIRESGVLLPVVKTV